MALPTHLLESLQLRVLEDIDKLLQALPERIAESNQRHGLVPRPGAVPEHATGATTAPAAAQATAPPGSGRKGADIGWRATERLFGAAGAFVPALGQVGQTMRDVRELVDAIANFRKVWGGNRTKPPRRARPRKSKARPDRLPIPAPPIRVYPRRVPWATEDEMLRGPRGLVPRVIDQQGNPVLPRTPLPGPSVPLLEDRRAAASASASGTTAAASSAPPIIPPGVPLPGSAPERTTSLPPGGPDPFAEWRRALNVDLNDPDAYEVDINTGELTLPGQDTPPLTGSTHGASFASSERMEALLEKGVQVGEQIARALEEDAANEDGGIPSAAEREQGNRKSMWNDGEASTPQRAADTAKAINKLGRFPGRPERKPEGEGLGAAILKAAAEFFL